VLEDVLTGAIVASGTIFLERKFIRANALVIIFLLFVFNHCKAGHIEDIVVHSESRQKGYGKM